MSAAEWAQVTVVTLALVTVMIVTFCVFTAEPKPKGSAVWNMSLQWSLAENAASVRGPAYDDQFPGLLPGEQAGPGQRPPPATPASARVAAMRRRQRSPRPQER